MSKNELRFEKLLARYCAPVLKHQKAGNMFHIASDEIYNLNDVIRSYNSIFNRKGIYFKLLLSECKRITVFVYDYKLLSSILKKKDVICFLSNYGYAGKTIDDYFFHLEKRLHLCAYPHEIGIFLGYPLKDIEGFIDKKHCKLCGYYRVYHNVEKAKKTFALYDYCLKELEKQMQFGYSLKQIII